MTFSAAPPDARGIGTAALSPWLWAGIGIALLHLAVWYALPELPMLDMPNHTARAKVVADLLFDGGRRFGELFEMRVGWEPYVLGDLLLASLVRILGPVPAAQTLVTLAFLTPALAAVLYLRDRGVGWRACALVFLAMLFVATDWTFTLGFAHFRLCLPLVLIALLFAERFLERPGLVRYLGFALAAALGFMMHLAAPVLLGLALAGLALARWPLDRTQFARFAMLGAMPLGIVALHVLQSPADPAPYRWYPLWNKYQVAKGFFQRFERIPDNLFTLLFGLSVAIPMLFALHRLRVRSVTRDAAFICGICTLGYFALPTYRGEVQGIDVRVLPLALTFAAIAAFTAIEDRRTQQRLPQFARRLGGPAVWAGAMLSVLTLLNAAYLSRHMRELDARLGAVREVLAALPRGARVFPIITTQGWRGSLLHAHGFAMVDRDALTPYIFSGDQGYPQAYFRYRDRPYAPTQWWYLFGRGIDWRAVRAEWPYILIVGARSEWPQIPFPAEPVARSEAATLLRVHAPDATAHMARPSHPPSGSRAGS